MEKMQIHEGWELRNVKEQEWIGAQVPGDIYSALLAAGKMEDPFFGDNEYKAKVLMEEDYEYRTHFSAASDPFADCDEVLLRFEGIDTVADIYLNDCYLGKADNMHRVWEYAIGDVMQSENELRVVIGSPLKFMEEAFHKYRNIGNEDTIEGFMHLRKAHYMSGWDWGACLPDGGIFRPVTLLGVKEARIDGVYIRQRHEDGRVWLEPEVDMELFTDEAADKDLFYEVVITAPDGSQVTYADSPDEIEIEEPKLWWPNGLGEQPLYTVKVI